MSIIFNKLNGVWPWHDASRPRWQRYQLYLRSPHWQLKRLQCLDRSGRQCENCYSRNRLTIHHLNYENLFEENLGDLVCLCWPCHKKAEKCSRVLHELMEELRAIQPARREKSRPKPFPRIAKKVADEIEEAERSGIATAFYGKSIPWFKPALDSKMESATGGF